MLHKKAFIKKTRKGKIQQVGSADRLSVTACAYDIAANTNWLAAAGSAE